MLHYEGKYSEQYNYESIRTGMFCRFIQSECVLLTIFQVKQRKIFIEHLGRLLLPILFVGIVKTLYIIYHYMKDAVTLLSGT